MRAAGIILKTTAAALFLLCMLVPQYAAAPSVQPAQHDVYFDTVFSFLFHRLSTIANKVWGHQSPYVNDVPVTPATLPEPEEPTTLAIELPSWESIVASADKIVKAAEETLSAATRELNVAGRIKELEGTFHGILAASAEIRGHVVEITQQGLTLDQVSDELGIVFNDTLIYLAQTFPSSDQAPGHEERLKMTTTVLDRAEQGLLELGGKHGMSEDGLERVRRSFASLKPHIENLVVITGDLVEQHPVLFSTLISSVVGILIPESWILRPLLSLMGYGPYGPIKGSPAAWAQRRFWGAAVAKDSWFAILQKAGMKGTSARSFFGAIGGMIGGLFKKLFH